MKLILCPTDFSACATNAVRYGAALAHEFNARLVLLHVYETPIYSESPMVGIEDVDEEIRMGAEKKLKTLIAKLGKEFQGLNIEFYLEQGFPHEKVIELGGKMGCDMIVLGSTGTSKLQRLLMGSTTARVIRDAHCPVLCIPKDTEFKGVKKIVFATDLHEDNVSSAMTIASFAAHFDAELVFIFVDDKHFLHSDEYVEEMTKKIRKRVKYPKISGYISKNTSIAKGIDYFLRKNPGDLLAMFTHERHFPESLFSSSITRIMSYQTRIPLLALKHEDRDIMSKG